MEKSLHNLFNKYLDDHCSEQEVLLLLEYFKVSENEPELKQLILDELSADGVLATHVPDVDQRLDVIYANLKQHTADNSTKAVRQISIWPRIAVAASLAFVIAFGGYLYFSKPKQKTEHYSTYANDIAPGRNTATLTLADGKKINLSDAINGELAKEAGISISKTADGMIVYEVKHTGAVSGKINTLTTARGETYQICLPDGTMVTLNAASSIKYPVSFTSLNKRTVELTGEAYFEVAKDKQHPFVVKTNGQEVEVLGTHFNVNSYDEDGVTKTTLLEGSVRVVNHLSHSSSVLKPGEQAALKSGELVVTEVDVNKAVGWKNGKFVFDNESIESIMRKLARWYNVEIVYEGDVRHIAFSGIMSRDVAVSGILNKISQTGAVHFKIEGRRITVMP